MNINHFFLSTSTLEPEPVPGSEGPPQTSPERLHWEYQNNLLTRRKFTLVFSQIVKRLTDTDAMKYTIVVSATGMFSYVFRILIVLYVAGFRVKFEKKDPVPD